MSTRRRILGGIGIGSGRHVTGIDVAALLRRLILFDSVIIRSNRLYELAHLVKVFGKSGLITALNSGAIQFSCEFTYLILGIAVNGVPSLPPDHFSFGIAEGRDRESLLAAGFLSLQTISGLKNPDRAAIEDAVRNAIVRQHPTFGADLQMQVELDLRSNSPILRASLLHVLNEKGLIARSQEPLLHLKVEEVKPRTFRVDHNISKLLGIDSISASALVSSAVSGVNGLNSRLAEMSTYSAITGLSTEEVPLLFGKLAGLVDPFDLNPNVPEGRFSRVLSIADIAEPSQESRLDIERILEVRSSPECSAFKKWLEDSDSLSDEDVGDLLKGIRSKLGILAASVEGRLLRFVATTAVGTIPPLAVPAIMLGFVDSFLLEKLFPKSGIVSFLKKGYPTVFER